MLDRVRRRAFISDLSREDHASGEGERMESMLGAGTERYTIFVWKGRKRSSHRLSPQ